MGSPVKGGRQREGWKQRLLDGLERGLEWGERRIPPGLRLVVGVVLMAAGLVGFLPVLGFWMVPLGAVVAALDIPPLRRRLKRWLERRKRDSAEGGGAD